MRLMPAPLSHAGGPITVIQYSTSDVLHCVRLVSPEAAADKGNHVAVPALCVAVSSKTGSSGTSDKAQDVAPSSFTVALSGTAPDLHFPSSSLQ
jgi:hypothetical protein